MWTGTGRPLSGIADGQWTEPSESRPIVLDSGKCLRLSYDRLLQRYALEVRKFQQLDQTISTRKFISSSVLGFGLYALLVLRLRTARQRRGRQQLAASIAVAEYDGQLIDNRSTAAQQYYDDNDNGQEYHRPTNDNGTSRTGGYHAAPARLPFVDRLSGSSVSRSEYYHDHD